jgi:aminoglycoside phosphotransferase (APT) family kinase protein
MLETLLAQINQAHSTSFQLGSRYRDGEQGAYNLVDERGRQFVLKVAPDPTAAGRLTAVAAITDELRAVGYPAPRYVVTGATGQTAYSVQTELRGEPVRQVTIGQLPQLLALNALQAGLATDRPRTWPEPVVTPSLEGGPGFCLLEPMRTHSPETAALLERLQAIVRGRAALALPQGDVVHFDFTPLNILAEGATISGVIDWDGVCAGDRAFDLATLLFYSHRDLAVADSLYATARGLVGPEAISLYLAHLAHRTVEWAIRHHPQLVDYLLGVAERQLTRYAAAAGA